MAALAEFHRVLAPGGTLALLPDWGGFLVSPDSAEVRAAMRACEQLRPATAATRGSGGSCGAGAEAGFVDVKFTASYEVYDPPGVVGEFMALRLEAEGDERWARAYGIGLRPRSCLRAGVV